jgi:PKD repeat protein
VITQWLWSFPHDASTFNTKRITKSFPAPGTYQAVLVLVKNGCALDTIVEDIVITTPITTQLTATPQPACEGATVVVTASASGSVAPYTYSWSAIDANGIVGSTTDSTATIRHDASGTFRYRVTVTDALGCIGVQDTSLVFLDGPEIQLDRAHGTVL